MLQSLLLHSPLTWHEFKPLGLGLEPQLTTWESIDIGIALTAGPHAKIFYLNDMHLIHTGKKHVSGCKNVQ